MLAYMKIDPVTISLIALGVSIFSLAMSSHRAAVDRRVQWEQLRGAIQARLTARGLDMLTMIEEVSRSSTDQATDLTKKLMRIVEGLVDIRKRLKNMEELPPFTVSYCITGLAPIKSELDDADLIFDVLGASIREGKFSEASTAADGLLERLYGAEKKG